MQTSAPPGAARADERRAYQQARAQRAQERQKARAGDVPPGTETIGGEVGDGEAGELSPEMRLEKIAQALEEAEAAAESGQERDPMKIYNKIAEVIGIRPYPGEEPNT
jgi:hypothetical protein